MRQALAGEINQRMPGYVCQRVQRLLNDHNKPVRWSCAPPSAEAVVVTPELDASVLVKLVQRDGDTGAFRELRPEQQPSNPKLQRAEIAPGWAPLPSCSAAPSPRSSGRGTAVMAGRW